jgi:hypothetical protein
MIHTDYPCNTIRPCTTMPRHFHGSLPIFH